MGPNEVTWKNVAGAIKSASATIFQSRNVSFKEVICIKRLDDPRVKFDPYICIKNLIPPQKNGSHESNDP